jgi:hypothetical protein
MKYRKRPVIIDAMQIPQCGPEHRAERARFQAWVEDNKGTRIVFWADQGVLTIRTLEGDMNARAGDYVIKGVKGEMYPCREDIFQETYEAVDG